MVKGGELPGLLRLRARDSRRSKAWFLGWNTGATPGWVDSWKSGELVITLKYSMIVALGNIRLRGCYKPWCKAWKIIPDQAWLIRSKGNVVLKTLSEWKLGRAAECKLVLKKQEDNCPHKWQRGWLLGYIHLWQYPTTKQVEAWITA